jgi:hypothetical protein
MAAENIQALACSGILAEDEIEGGRL